MDLPTLYARKEPTNDAWPLKQGVKLTRKHRDVVFYQDAEACKPVSRYPWHFNLSKPDKRHKYKYHNCGRYKLIWLADV